MNQRKPNNSLWYSLGLAVLLMAGCLVAFTGSSLARYRAEREKTIQFTVRVPDQVYLGTMQTVTDEDTDASGEGTLTFVSSAGASWETVNGVAQMEFAVANGASEEEFAAMDQQIRIRLMGSLGLWTGTETAKVKLLLPAPTEEDPENCEEIAADVTRISKESPLYKVFGDGWVFTFPDEKGEERVWTLEGGEFSYISMKIIVEDVALTEASLLQLQVTGETVQ